MLSYAADTIDISQVIFYLLESEALGTFFKWEGWGVFGCVKFEFKGILARMFYYRELWDRGQNLPMNPLHAPSKYQEGRKRVLAWLLRLTVNIFPLLPLEMFFTVNSFTS